MLPIQRKEEILNFVIEQGSCRIEELSTRFDVSKVTIHRILNELELSGKIKKVRGGVRATRDESTPVIRFSERVDVRSKQKDAIARLALDLINPGDTIFVDSSTTGLSLIRCLARNKECPITILSNSPVAVLELDRARHLQFISTGGELHSDSYTYAGDLTLEALDSSPGLMTLIIGGVVVPSMVIPTLGRPFVV